MIRRLLRRVTFDHFAIALVLVITGGVYYAAADALMRSAAHSAGADAHRRARADATRPADGETVAGARIAALFDRLGYRLETVRADGEVPRVFLASLPSELPDIAVAAQRKIMFIEATLPLILRVNEQIAQDRQLLADLRDRLADGDRLSAGDRTWLAHEAALYGLDGFDPGHPDMDELMRRVDIIPPSLALAQSAEESGWGTSRFAQHGNALFGQRSWRGESGLVPKQHDGEPFRVASFDRLMDAVRSYALNLDSHPAYEAFRRARAAQRREDETLDGFVLAGTLAAYSERGVAYVDAIRAIIRANALDVFDQARLNDPVVTAGNGLPDA
jgi:Bax protein